MSELSISQGDCLELLKLVPDGSCDMICTDLPYGVTNSGSEAGKWDCVIPFEPLWEQFLRVAKKNAAIVLFAQGMFTAQLMMSRPKLWRYNIVWDKCRASGFLNANRMPLRCHEDICVFYRELPTYNPQMVWVCDSQRSHSRGRTDKDFKNSCYGKMKLAEDNITNEKFPQSIVSIPREGPSLLVHPTQKPVAICEWLINTYTNRGETVLDATMGSGTTGVACVKTDRSFIGFEQSEKYFKIAYDRISAEEKKPHQEELFQ